MAQSSFNLLQDEEDLQAFVIRCGREQYMVSEPWKPHLQVHAPALDAAATGALRRELESVLSDNLSDESTLIARTVGTTETSERTPPPPTTGQMRVDLQGIGVPKSSQIHLEMLLKARAQQLLSTSTATASRSMRSTGSHDPAAIQICASTAPGDYIPLPREQILEILTRTPERPFLPLRVALALSRRGRDALLMEIYPVDPSLGPSAVRVGLAKAVSWAKELLAHTVCPPHDHQRLHVSGPTTSWMTLSSSDQLDSLVFRKPGFAGVWIDVAYFNMREFLDLFGGRWIKFTWMFD